MDSQDKSPCTYWTGKIHLGFVVLLRSTCSSLIPYAYPTSDRHSDGQSDGRLRGIGLRTDWRYLSY